MIFPLRGVLDLIPIGISLWMQWKLTEWLPQFVNAGGPRRWQPALRRAWWISACWMVGSALYGILTAWPWMPAAPALDWIRGASICWGMAAGGLFMAAWLLRLLPEVSPSSSRRRFLLSARGAFLTAPVVFAGAAVIVERNRFVTVEKDLHYPGLPPDLDGLRIAHISDIHRGPFLDREELERLVAMSNEMRAHLAVVTGDLITARDDYLTDCVTTLGGLRADAGVIGCLGNHEIVARCQGRAKREGAAVGLDFLRGEKRVLRFGKAQLNVAGVDYQRMGRPYLAGAERWRRPDAFNLMLSHNPDVFPVAADQGWDLTLAGHTHGGQLTIEGLRQYVNIARIFTPYVYGAYERSGSKIFVTSGIGTVGVPARMGAPPEVAFIRLCAT